MNTSPGNKEASKSFSLKKAERLNSKKLIDKLFAEGDSILQYPLKMVFLKTELPVKYPAQTAFTVSKKLFKRAVHRNRVKRLLRETYRLNKHILYETLQTEQLAIFIIYIGKELPEYKQIDVATSKGLKKVLHKLTKKSSPGNEH